jgi:hypothetical protein
VKVAAELEEHGYDKTLDFRPRREGGASTEQERKTGETHTLVTGSSGFFAFFTSLLSFPKLNNNVIFVPHFGPKR